MPRRAKVSPWSLGGGNAQHVNGLLSAYLEGGAAIIKYLTQSRILRPASFLLVLGVCAMNLNSPPASASGYDELLAEDGVYAKLFLRQAEGYR